MVSSIETRNLPTRDQEKFMISKYHFFQVTSDAPGILKTSEYINELVHNHFPLRKAKVKQLELPTQPIYQGKIPINSSKMDDLKKLRPYITNGALEFWNLIYQWPTVTKETK